MISYFYLDAIIPLETSQNVCRRNIFWPSLILLSNYSLFICFFYHCLITNTKPPDHSRKCFFLCIKNIELWIILQHFRQILGASYYQSSLRIMTRRNQFTTCQRHGSRFMSMLAPMRPMTSMLANGRWDSLKEARKNLL